MKWRLTHSRSLIHELRDAEGRCVARVWPVPRVAWDQGASQAWFGSVLSTADDDSKHHPSAEAAKAWCDAKLAARRTA